MNKIPKKIFFYWGGEQLSWMRYMTLYSFRKMNPDWDIILYTSSDYNEKQIWTGKAEQDYFSYTKNDTYFSKLEELNIIIKPVIFPDSHNDFVKNMNPVYRSDIFRYYKLYEEGGFYSDMDVLFFRPMNDLYDDLVKNDSDTLFFQETNLTSIGFLGSSINNDFYKRLFDNIKGVNQVGYQAFGIVYINSLYNSNPARPTVIQKIKQIHPHLKVYNLPMYTVYKYGSSVTEGMYNKNFNISDWHEKSIGYHWYGGNPKSQEYNNILNENNYEQYNTAFSSLVKYIKNNN